MFNKDIATAKKLSDFKKEWLKMNLNWNRRKIEEEHALKQKTLETDQELKQNELIYKLQWS